MDANDAIDKFRQFVKGVPGYAPETFDIALPYIEVRRVEKGDFVVELGKTSRYLAFVAEGFIRGYKLFDGVESTTCLCGSNSFATSTSSFITQSPSSLALQALEPVTLVLLSHDSLQNLYAVSPFWEKVGRYIAEHEFLSMHSNSWRNSPISAHEKYLTLMSENPGIVNTVPLHYIASYIGITPETLSRIRRKLSKGIS